MPSSSVNRPMVPLRLDPDIKAKLQYIADDNFRPVNKELEMLIMRHIADYESQNGVIPVVKGESSDK